jgi:hypothetical protein
VREYGSNYDIIVCGGGPSGVAAALAASRRGAKTLLIERYGFCGGMATSALVNPWSGHEYYNFDTQRNGSLIGGIFKEIIINLDKRKGYGSDLTANAFDEEKLKFVYDEMLLAAGVDILYHTYLAGVEVEDARISAVNIVSKSGMKQIKALNFVDATGDADLAALAGLEFNIGRPSDGLTQAMTVSFRMGNVDKAEMIASNNLREARALVEPYFQQAIASGQLYYPYRNFVHFYDFPKPGVLHFNMTRINTVSGLSVNDLTKAEIEGRNQVYTITDWLKKAVPWFKNSYIEKIACQVGVRETRHIRGLYTMTREDITSAEKFGDGIARSRYFIDIHNPKGAIDIQQKEGERGTVRVDFSPPRGDFYEISYRCLVTEDCPNIIIPCRALSATHEASAAIRVMATIVGLGEAAGIAAAEATKKEENLNSISGEWVRSQIPDMSEGADDDYPWIAPPRSLNFLNHG